MPLLLNVLRNAEGPDYRKLRVKAMECAGLIGGLFFFGGVFLGGADVFGLGQLLLLGGTCSGRMRICLWSCLCGYRVGGVFPYCSGCLILIWGFGGICR